MHFSISALLVAIPLAISFPTFHISGPRAIHNIISRQDANNSTPLDLPSGVAAASGSLPSGTAASSGAIPSGTPSPTGDIASFGGLSFAAGDAPPAAIPTGVVDGPAPSGSQASLVGNVRRQAEPTSGTTTRTTFAIIPTPAPSGAPPGPAVNGTDVPGPLGNCTDPAAPGNATDGPGAAAASGSSLATPVSLPTHPAALKL